MPRAYNHTGGYGRQRPSGGIPNPGPRWQRTPDTPLQAPATTPAHTPEPAPSTAQPVQTTSVLPAAQSGGMSSGLGPYGGLPVNLDGGLPGSSSLPAMEDGGAVGDTDGSEDYMASVRAALDYGRRKHGLIPGGGDDDTQQFAEGGEVEEPAAPAPDEDTAGGIPSPDNDAQAQAPKPTGGILDPAGAGPARLAGKAIIDYLMGADAAAPKEVQELKQRVDPEGKLSESERNLAAVHVAAQDGGPEASWGITQHLRQKYDAGKGWTAAAVSNGDIQGAADAATKTLAALPDGKEIQFVPAQGGMITATVTGKDPIAVSPEALTQFMRGPEGQFDRAISKGSDEILKEIAQAGGQPARSISVYPGQRAQRDIVWQGADPTGRTAVPREPAMDADERKLQQQADRIFPMVSQTRKRELWLAEQQDKMRDAQSKIDVAKETARGRTESANATAQGRVESARLRSNADVLRSTIGANASTENMKTRVMGMIDAQAKRNEGTRYAAKLRTVNAKIAASSLAGISLDNFGAWLHENNVELDEGHVTEPPAGRPQQQQQQRQGAAPQSGPSIFTASDGSKWTRGPDGKAVRYGAGNQ